MVNKYCSYSNHENHYILQQNVYSGVDESALKEALILFKKFNLMKTNKLLLLVFVAAVLSTSCSRKVVVVKSHPSGHIPPGQAKKMNGSTSAKQYAPGQKKKK